MSTRISTDGPDAVLFRIARKLRLRYSQAFVVQAMAAHPRPRTLLALVEIAHRMGIEPKPVQTNIEGLSSLRLPAVVHFNGPSGEGGFGTLEGVSEDAVRIWDSANGRRSMSHDQFLAHWSGVAVWFERADQSGAPEHRYRRQRFLEVVAGGTKTPAVSGGRAAPVLRAVLTGLIAVLLIGAIVGTPASDRPPVIIILLLALVGTAVTSLMALATGDQESALADRVCKRGKLVDCHSVLTSRYSRVFGLPLSDIGLALYGAIVLLIASSGWSEPGPAWRVITLAFSATLPFAILLVALQISMRQLCTLCIATHAVNTTGAVIGWLLWRPGLGGRDLYPALLLGLYFAITLFLVIPYFRRSASLAFISDRYRRMAASPFGSLAQLLTQPPTAVEAASIGVPVEGPSGRHQVVILVHPSCGKCLPALRELLALRQSVPMNVFVGVAPKDPTAADRHASSVLVAAWMAMGSDRVVDGYSAAKKHLGKLSGRDALSLLAVELGLDPQEIARRLPVARALVDSAEQAVDKHADGTPAIFVDSRPYTAPLAHLAYLIEKHPDLVSLS